MRLLVSGCTKTTRRLMALRPDRLGVLLTPGNGNAEWWGPECFWACDNDCFKGLNAPAYLKMLAKIAAFRCPPRWVACPDVVADAGATWESFHRWQPILELMNLPVALVLQDGLERLKYRATLPQTWNLLDAVFVGGSTAWKLSDHAARLTLEAHERGKLVHWGRINTRKRIRYLAQEKLAGRLWVDSVDGSGFSAFGEQKIPAFIRWADGAFANHQPLLFG